MRNHEIQASPAKQSLPDMVYRQLRHAILNGSFSPGQMLRQDELATQLGVSRSPLREALPRLEAEGIVVQHPRRGYAVTELRSDEIKEVFELRVLLETAIAKHAISNRTEADIAQVYEIAGRMRTIAEGAPQDKDWAQWFELNQLFHEALQAPAELPHYQRSLATARGVMEAYIRNEVRLTGDLLQAQKEHGELAQAFVEGNSDLFVELTIAHSQHTRDRLLFALQQHAD